MVNLVKEVAGALLDNCTIRESRESPTPYYNYNPLPPSPASPLWPKSTLPNINPLSS